MDTLGELRRRLETTDDIAGIVRTMKALAAVSIRQYEAAVSSLADYSRTIELGLHAALRDLPAIEEAMRPGAGIRAVGAVIFGSDHGLCGRFNEDIVAHALARLGERPAGTGLHVFAIGARVAGLLEHSGQAAERQMPGPGSSARIGTTVREVLLEIDAWQHQAGVQRVYLFHNRSGPGERHRPATVRLLPVSPARLRSLAAKRWPGPSLPAFTMERKALVAALLRQYFFVSVFRASAESLAAENVTRLAAMQAAERNLAERHAELLAGLRRSRQEAITTELLDVIAGYEALHGQSR
ncbi:MAG: F0F1 ATP synthase subunit gamma [Anaerolineae bacterium]|nr:F0F1 ATP synthase subunit gamma [Anaerolineae bacterium]